MPLQNRVTPLGEIIADPARGTLMGNRGILHDHDRKLGQSRWKHKAWIACALAFRGRRRTPMTQGRYTELFFLDEATALAAGHRPCAECRRASFDVYRAAWATAHHLDAPPSAKAMDDALHAHRVKPRLREQVHHTRAAADVPDGAFVLVDRAPWLVWKRRLLRWSPSGYDRVGSLPGGRLAVVTPQPGVEALAAGYRVTVHDSASDLVGD
ncbi:hypothetical protein [Aurantimonas sp. A3-2-R12]|uniref:hypothetical protein n=1 Tax=Aurantimonas sp. A3-2-R12 TaxID=3114362 RepID=UPI002E185957|nr:hypothetical protein [Aurantimonas sp. A3-2-R12]